MFILLTYRIIRAIFSKYVYKAIKYAPKYPKGFKAVQNGTLEELRQIESGSWKKVYKDGYDKDGKNIYSLFPK